jgi:hypothetical protein
MARVIRIFAPYWISFARLPLIRIFAPYWISFARLPPLTLRLIDMSGRKNKRRFLTRPHLERSEKHLYDIKPDKLVEGYTIASGLNFKGLGLSSSVGRHGGRFGSMKELSSLGDMVSLNLLVFFSTSLIIMMLFLISSSLM